MYRPSMTTTAPDRPTGDLPARVVAADDRLLAELTAGTVVSAVAGVAVWAVGRRRGDAVLSRFGRQTLGWAGVDALVVALGRAQRTVPADDDAARAQAARLARVTGLNALADVGYLASAAVVASPRLPRWTPARRGDAAAVAVQALFLLALDTRHALRVRRLQ